MRILQYASYLASGGLQKLSRESSGEKFLIFAEAISECRTVLRLFDDAAMLSYARNYGTGKQVGKSKKLNSVGRSVVLVDYWSSVDDQSISRLGYGRSVGCRGPSVGQWVGRSMTMSQSVSQSDRQTERQSVIQLMS